MRAGGGMTEATRKRRQRVNKGRGWRYVSGWLPAAQAAQVEAMIEEARDEQVRRGDRDGTSSEGEAGSVGGL
jgi:protein subunit release factor A